MVFCYDITRIVEVCFKLTPFFRPNHPMNICLVNIKIPTSTVAVIHHTFSSQRTFFKIVTILFYLTFFTFS